MKFTIELEQDNKEDLELLRKLVDDKIYSIQMNTIKNSTKLSKEKNNVLNIISDLIDKKGESVLIENIIEEAKKQNISRKKAEDSVSFLINHGFLLIPREEIVQKV